MKIIKSHYIAVLIGTAIFFAGCAVLTVDVDVYKGPLANHKDVQTEQMAAMAIGAKPLLVELRDRLEVIGWELVDVNEFESNDEELYTFQHPYSSLEELRHEPWYKSDYVETSFYEFTSPNADNVNNVLSLYKNRISDEYLALRTHADRAFKNYRAAYKILSPESMVEDKALARSIQLVKGEPKDVNNLKNAYIKFLRSERRYPDDIIQKSLNWLNKTKVVDNRVEELRKNTLLMKDQNSSEAENAWNAAFHILAETDLVDLLSEHVFELKGSRRKEMIFRIKEIARVYLDARAALEELWRISMEMIIYVNSRPMAEGETEEQRRELTESFVRLSLEHIQPKYLAALLWDQDVTEASQTLKRLKKVIPEYATIHDPNKTWTSDDYESAKRTLNKVIVERPVEMAKMLLAAHRFAKYEFIPHGTDFKSKHLKYKSAWEFGLARTPYEESFPDYTLEVLNQTEQQVYAAIKGGAFGGGRLDKGLETLIEEYLNLSANDMANKDELEFARQQLSNALVRFAEKILFIANKKSFLQDPTENDRGIFVDLVEVITHGLVGGQNDRFQDFKQFEIQNQRILQAVGNSILVQADALQQERRHRERLESHYEKEAAILSDTLDRFSPVNRNSTGISSVKDKLSEYTTAKDIRDVWIELLEYEHDLALYYGDTNRAKQIKEALDAARKKREGMIFIRPAMAYLRTSFPATSLQSNPNLTWDNMLGSHMMRSMPFGPQIGEFFNPDAKRDARINAEIDKQFWQNINRVRVAGGGNTNYAVVKDDIGNWYVKGYSADPCDIIDSARNLGMFSLGAKLNTDLPGQINRDNADLPDTNESDANKTAVERMYNKYTEQYNSRTSADRERLTDILENEMKSAIIQAWQRNEELKDDDVSKLENKLETAIELHLKNPTDELKETEDITEHGSKIISALHAIRRFHHKLLADVHDTVTVPARDNLLEKEKNKDTIEEADLNEAKEKYNVAKRAEKRSIRDITRIVREKIMALIISRMDSVQDYETALMFIGESNTQ